MWRHCCPEANRFNFSSSRNAVEEPENGEISVLSEVNSTWSVPFIAYTLPHLRKLLCCFQKVCPSITHYCVSLQLVQVTSHTYYSSSFPGEKGMFTNMTLTVFPFWKLHEMFTKATFTAKDSVFLQTPLYLPMLFLQLEIWFLPAVALVILQMAIWADGLEVHTTNTQQRRIHGFALLQLPGSAEMSKTCYSPFGNMLWLLINANSLLSTVIHNYFSVNKWLTTISTSSSGANSIP